MVPRKLRTFLAMATVVLLSGAPFTLAAPNSGAWSGTVAAVRGDDVALVGVPAHFRLAGSVTEMASGRSVAAQTLAPGTSVTLRVGEREVDGRLRADRIEVQAKSPLSVSGLIGNVSSDRSRMEVQGVEIELDRNTGFSGRDASGRLHSSRDLRPGMLVSALLAPTAGGALRASQVRATLGPAEAGEDQELSGIVTAITDTAWTIDARVLGVTDQTVFEGDPGLGDFVEAKFHDDGSGNLVADRIEKEDEAQGAEVEFVGIVEAIGDASWTISGQVVGIDASTLIEGSPAVGDSVEVHAAKAADGSLLATRIQREDAGDQNDDHGGATAGNDGSNHDAGDDHGGATAGNDDGSSHDAGDDNGGNGTPTTSSGGNRHGHGGDDSGIDN